jgi:hypothetical protein
MPSSGPFRRRPQVAQLRFGFKELADRRERLFKRAIVAVTAILVLGLLVSNLKVRSLALELARGLLLRVNRVAGLETTREEIDAYWRAKRQLDVAQTERVFRTVYHEADGPTKALLRAAGMSADDALLRWGNFDRVLLLSSKVFAPDDHGRSYRLRPNTKSFWLRTISLPNGLAAMFLVPDTPEVQEATASCRAIVVPESVQTTNSWGCRGPEPDLSAPVRGLVLGDSFMQGLFISNEDTPPACLERDLQERIGKRVCILNTGHLGYSIDQYYFTLLEYADRFRPQFVVVSLFANDFGETFEVLNGGGNWKEGEYWLAQIQQYCTTRNIPIIVVPVPTSQQVMGSRRDDHYQCRVAEIFPYSTIYFVDPLEDFVNEHLRLTNEGTRRGKRPSDSPLFNGKYHDGHFSAAGSELWARAVGRRIALLLERQELSSRPRN